MVGSIVGIVLLIGSVILIRSYALYEEKKEFNVLKGQIPDFGYDIKMLSVVIDGEKSKNIPERGYYKTQIDCSNGTRGEWDYNAWNLTLENVSENARCNITFTSNLNEEEYNKYIEAGKALRRNTYRGKDITSYHNDGSLYEMISSGRFDDIYVGDYIKSTVNGMEIIWLVADIDNYLYTGDNKLTKHHITIIPLSNLGGGVMNDINSNESGYYNCKMKQTVLPNVLKTYIKPVFSSHILTYRNYLTNAVGTTVTFAWYDSQIDLMSEVNVYGASLASSTYNDNGIDNQQYALFRLEPSFITTKEGVNFFLKNVSTSDGFLFSFRQGLPSHYNANNALSVRPRFLVG